MVKKANGKLEKREREREGRRRIVVFIIIVRKAFWMHKETIKDHLGVLRGE